MLLEFRLENYRSFREAQTLSMIASADKTDLRTHAVPTKFGDAKQVLRTAVMYGPNASGKSNIFKGLQCLQLLVLHSHAAGLSSPVAGIVPFRLDNDSSQHPTEIEVTFIVDQVRYQYGITADNSRVLEEYLYVYQSIKPQRWFHRRFDEQTQDYHYDFSSNFKGSKQLWVSATRQNSLFLSVAIHLNSDSLKPIYHWFAEKLVIINETTPLNSQFSVNLIKSKPDGGRLVPFLQSADIQITSIEVETKQIPAFRVNLDSEKGVVAQGGVLQDFDEVRFVHQAGNALVKFDPFDESTGTRNLFALAGPILHSLDNGCVVLIDELEKTLHTNLARAIVRSFVDPKANKSNAQLIFTSHNTTLLDEYGLFRRDQIWFLEKNRDRESSLIPLTDFSPRKDEALAKGYLRGRYGAIPFIEQLNTECENGDQHAK